MSQLEAHSYRADPSVPGFPDDKPVVVLDGFCVLCARSAQFVLAHDSASRLRMTAAQSRLGEALFRHYGLKHGDYESVLLIEGGRLRTKSDAALRILEILGIWAWRTRIMRAAPRWFADMVYDAVARNRIRVWGARDTCFVPPPGSEDRFL